MQRSNTNFTACARYNLIFCAGEMEEWAKKRKPPTNKQLKSLWQLLDGNFPITLFPFDSILSKVQLCKYSISACRTCFSFISATVRKKKQTHRRWLDLPLQRFSECNHLRIQTARLPAEEQHFYFPPSANETPAMNNLLAVIMTW